MEVDFLLVPARPQSEKSNTTGNKNKPEKPRAEKKLLPKQATPDGDNKENSTEQLPQQATLDGDNKIDTAEDCASLLVPAAIPVTGEHIETSGSEDQLNTHQVEKLQDAKQEAELPSDKTAKKDQLNTHQIEKLQDAKQEAELPSDKTAKKDQLNTHQIEKLQDAKQEAELPSDKTAKKDQLNTHQIEKLQDAKQEAELPSDKTAKKVVKKKKKTDFTVKTASDEQRDCGSNKDVNKQKGHGDKEKMRKKKGSDVPKQKQPKEKKEPKEKKDAKSKEPKMTLPVRSLTDEEYRTIFDAAVENAMNLNMDEWLPKATSPVKVKEPVKKKYSVTVGKKVNKSVKQMMSQQSQESCPRQDVEISDNTEDKEHEVSIGLDNSEDGDEHITSEVEEEQEQEVSKDHESKEEAVVEVEEIDNQGQGKAEDAEEHCDVSNDIQEEENEIGDADEEIVVDDLDEEPVQESAQQENETTPVGSEVDAGEKQVMCTTTPVKKKKKLPKIGKNPKLEPKQLPFKGQSELSMVDKVKQMKKVKKEKQEDSTKKRKLDHDKKKQALEKVERKSHTSLEDGKRKKPSEKKVSKRRKMQDRELEMNGTWVQCCNSTCMKWRNLPDISDPTLIPERWTCSMNPNKEFNSCDKAEEVYDESEHIYTKFAEGSIVWARMTGYPWWPAMVEIDPDAETYFSIDSDDSMIPTHYHVVFFDEHVSRTWVKADHVKIFTGSEEDDGIIYQISKKGSSYKKDITVAKKNAVRALSCTITERIELFGFAARYKGSWSINAKDKHKTSKHTPKQQKCTDVQEAYLDDSTMDDVLENTDALLDNVEEMLDSLNSQIDDSDADSDFMPDELVIVDTKRKGTARKSSVNSPKTNETGRKKMKISELNSDTHIATFNDRTSKGNGEVSKSDIDFKSETRKDESTTNVAQMSLKLDSDIFTMEMDTQDETFDKTNDTDNDDAKKISKKSARSNTTKDKKKEEREFQEPLSKFKVNSKKRNKKEISECNQPEVKVKKQKKINVEEVKEPLAETANDLEKEAIGNLDNVKQALSKEKDLNQHKQKVKGQVPESNDRDNSAKQEVVEENCLNCKERKANEQDDPKPHSANSLKGLDDITDDGYNDVDKDNDGNKKDIETHSKDTCEKEVCSQPKKECDSDTGSKLDIIEGGHKDNKITPIGVDKNDIRDDVDSDDELDLNEIENDVVPDLDREEANVGNEITPNGVDKKHIRDDDVDSDGELDLNEIENDVVPDLDRKEANMGNEITTNGEDKNHIRDVVDSGDELDLNEIESDAVPDLNREEAINVRKEITTNGEDKKHISDDDVDSDDELDLNEIENDTVPDLDGEEADVGNERNPGQSLEDESDSEFDLEEHYMYETNTDGSDKVRERGALNTQSHVVEIDEDSDPFDLMEE